MCIGGGKTGGYVNGDARHPPHTCDSWVIHTDSAGRSFLSSHTFPPSQPLTLNSSLWLVWSHLAKVWTVLASTGKGPQAGIRTRVKRAAHKVTGTDDRISQLDRNVLFSILPVHK